MPDAVRNEALSHSRLRFFAHALVPIGLLVFAIPFVALSFYASLNTDDYQKASLSFACVKQSGVLATTWLYYASPVGSGRWFTTIVQSLAMSKTSLVSSYGWLLLLVMVTNIAALTYFLENLLHVSRAKALLAAGIFYAVWLSSVLSPGENVFWLTEAFEYQFTMSTMLVLAALLCKTRHTTFSCIALAVLAIAVPGQHEIAGAFMLVVLIVGVIAARILKLPAAHWWLGLGLVAFSFGAEMFSPGMLGKLSQRPKMPWDLAHLLPYAKEVLGHGVSWIMSPAILVCAFCVPLLLSHEDSTGGQRRPPRWLALPGLGAMCVLLGEFASAEINSGYPQMPPRTVGWFQFVFWLLFVLVILIGVPELSQIRLPPISRIAISMLLVVSLLGSANFRSAEEDWRGPARTWHAASVARLTQRGSSLQFEPLPKRPSLFRYTALAMEPASGGC